MAYNTGILIYDGVDLQDIAAPYHLLARAVRPNRPESPLFKLHTVARTKEIVTCYGGLKILPDHIYPDAEIYDLILIPGGPGHQEALKVLRLMNWINQAAKLAEVVAAVDTGLYLLAAARLLDGQRVAAVPGLQAAYPAVRMAENEAVVRSGKLFTVSSHRFSEALAQAIITELE
jgi:putative intracellular protease/amidase